MPDIPSQFPSANAFLAAIIDSSEDAIISKSLEGIVTSWNSAAERIFGYTAAEMVGQPISKIIPPERGAEEPDILRRIGRGERVEHFETKRVRKDGRTVEVSLTISPIKDQNGKLVGASKIARDITEQKLTDRRIDEERERLRVTLSSIGDAVIVTDVRGALQYLNPVAEALTGWKQAEAEGKPLETVFNIINEQSRRRVESPAAIAMRDGIVIGLANHTVLISRDGSEMAIDDSAAPIRDGDGAVHGVVLVFRDVTGMRAAAEFRERLAAVVESSDDAIITKDLTGRITSWNRAAERMFGYSQEEAIGRPITMLIPPDRLDEEPKILANLKAGKRVDHFETIRIDRPTASTSVYPNMRSAAGFHEVMMLFRSLVMMASSDDSTTAANRRAAMFAAMRSVMSRAIFDAPTTRPVSSCIGDTVSEIGISVPSLRCRIVSKWVSDSPARMRPSTMSSSDWRSAGIIIRIERPTASAAV